MKLYVSVDMEGMAGIVHPRQEYEDQLLFRKNYNDQVRWALEAIFSSSIKDDIELVTVADSHGGGRNLSWDLTEVDDRISMVTGTPRPNYMMSCIDESYDLVFFLGYHAGVGERHANMCHTYMGRNIHYLTINGEYMNEASVNALYASEHKVPIGLIMGDNTLKKQIIDDEMMPWVEFVTTKDSVSFTAAHSKSKGRVKKELTEAIHKVLVSDYKALPLYELESPYTLEIEFNMASMYDGASQVPGAKHTGMNKLAWTFEDYSQLFNGIVAIGSLVGRSYPFEK